MFDLAPHVSFRRSWYRWKACATLFLKVLDSGEIELGLERYGPTNRGHQSVFGPLEGFFQSRFRLDRRKFWRSKSSTFYLNMSSFLRIRARGSTRCESGRLCARAWHRRGENCEISNIVLFHLSVFARMVDVAPDVGFRRSWCCWKACATFFLKVLSLYSGKLGFARCGPANKGCRNVFHVGG